MKSTEAIWPTRRRLKNPGSASKIGSPWRTISSAVDRSGPLFAKNETVSDEMSAQLTQFATHVQ